MFPFEVIPPEKSVRDRLLANYRGHKFGFVQVGPHKYTFPVKYEKVKERYYGLEPRPDDIWVMTFPRSGTTLTQEIMWLLNNNLDYETTARVPLDARFSFLESDILYSDQFFDELYELNGRTDEALRDISFLKASNSELLRSTASPRHIKTHIPLSLLHPNLVETSRVVFVARNPKDVAVSFFHYSRLWNGMGYSGDFDTFWTDFENGSVFWGPYWPRLEEAWKQRNHRNVLFLFFEDLINDLKGSIKKMSEFISKPISSADIDKLYEYCQIENFRKNAIVKSPEYSLHGMINPNGQPFIRRGKIGGNPEFSEALSERADSWIQKYSSKLNIQFPM